MRRNATGSVRERIGSDGQVYRSIRFVAYGERRFVSLGPVSRDEAQTALRHALSDVERGVWNPPAPEAVAPTGMPTFHEFADDWWLLNAPQLRPGTVADYKWRLEKHLLGFFKDMPLDEINVDAVERYKAAKLAETPKPLSRRSINMTLILLGAILEAAVERDLIGRNPARGKRRKLKAPTPRRTHLDSADLIASLLAAAALDAAAPKGRDHIKRQAILSTLVFAGLRIGELVALRWGDVDIASGWLSVGESKTEAGIRRVKIRGALRDELLSIRPVHADLDAFVFATSTGGPMSVENIRHRVLALSVKKANETRAKAKLLPVPDGLTPHGLRRTFASVLYAIGEDPGVVMDKMGHTDPALALSVYRKEMRRDEGEKAKLRALVEGADMGTGAAESGTSRHSPGERDSEPVEEQKAA